MANNKEEKVILNTSEESAKFVTISGWVDVYGHFWGKDERAARYSSCTHFVCQCGELARKPYTKCEKCISKENKDRYDQYPFEEWDESIPVFDDNTERYFTEVGEKIEFYEDNDLELSDLMLLICKPNQYAEIEEGYWSKIMPEDQEDFPKQLTEALNTFNEVLKSLPPLSYSPVKIRTLIKTK